MKIRLMGPADIVRAWAKELEKSYGIQCAEYPARGGSEVRVYADLDDRLAAAIVGLDGIPAGPIAQSMPVPVGQRRAIRRR